MKSLIFIALLAAGVVLMLLGMFGYSAIALGVALLSTFLIFPRQSTSGLQAVLSVFLAFSAMGLLTGFQPSWLPWTGVGIFGFLVLTVRMQ